MVLQASAQMRFTDDCIINSTLEKALQRFCGYRYNYDHLLDIAALSLNSWPAAEFYYDLTAIL